MFQVIPAIDLRDGKCVRLTKGEIGTETTYFENPVDALKNWTRMGAKTIHIVDLDAATGIGSNKNLIKYLLEMKGNGVSIQVGGGVRTAEIADDYLSLGVERVVMGTAAVKHPNLIRDLARRHGSEKIIVALDHKQGNVQIKGWTEDSGKDIYSTAKQLEDKGAGWILLSAVEADGAFTGPDIGTTKQMVETVGIPVLAAGGTRNLEDIIALRDKAGASGVVIGKALYEGRIDLASALHFNII